MRPVTPRVTRPPKYRPPSVTTPRWEETASRLAADAELYAQLREAGFAGPRYEIFQAELAAYGRPVLRKWIVTGEIYRRSAEKGRPVTVEPHIRAVLRDDADAREQLAHDAVMAGLELFHRTAMAGGAWQPQQGASLRSFFVGAVVLAFKDTHRRWARTYAYLAREAVALERDDVERWLSQIAGTANLQDQVVGTDQVTAYLDTLDSTNRAIIELLLTGMPPAQIAAHLAVTPERVRTRLHRLRATLRRDLGEEGTW